MNAAKLKKMEGQVRIGGKGSARRKRKHVQRTSTFDEKRMQTTLHKLSLTPVAGVNNVTLFMEDGKELMMNCPKVQGSVVSNMFVFTGDLFDALALNSQLEEEEDEDLPPLLVDVGTNVMANPKKNDDHKMPLQMEKTMWHNDQDLIVIEKPKQQSNNKKAKKQKQKKSSKTNSKDNINDDADEKEKPESTKDEKKDKSSDQQLAKNKKRKAKKPRNRVRSRNKIMNVAPQNAQDIAGILLMDGAGDGQNIEFSYLDLLDSNSITGSDKTSNFSDNSDVEQTIIGDSDSFITLCPDDDSIDIDFDDDDDDPGTSAEDNLLDLTNAD